MGVNGWGGPVNLGNTLWPPGANLRLPVRPLWLIVSLCAVLHFALAFTACRYLNERLVFGMAPDHIADVMTQRLRWAMGALQILMRDNPLRLVRGGWCVYERVCA